MFRYVLKTLLRHRTRTLLTICGAAVAMFVFCGVEAIQEGLRRLVTDSESNRGLVVYQENRFCPSTSHLPVDYARQIAKIPGVREVMPVQVWTNNCRASLDVVVFNGVNPQQVAQFRTFNIVDGTARGFETESNGALVGFTLAQRRGIKVGETFSIGPMSVKVSGIFRSEVAAEENVIFTPLDYLQLAEGTDRAGTVTLHEVIVQSGFDLNQVAESIDQNLKSGPVATKTRTRGAFMANAVTDLVDFIRFTAWLGYACLGLVLSIVATTTVMSVQDRIKEYAVLQTLGVRPLTAMRLVVTESSLLCIIGGLLGAGIAISLLAWLRLAMTTEGVSLGIAPSFRLAGLAAVLSVAVGVLAGIGPAIQAVQTPIVAALRRD
ncbi:MAG: ABC transporter permease [Pirellulaceae bacterium]|nr:ABC transporter permease [Pirellulaceae bacterium]